MKPRAVVISPAVSLAFGPDWRGSQWGFSLKEDHGLRERKVAKKSAKETRRCKKPTQRLWIGRHLEQVERALTPGGTQHCLGRAAGSYGSVLKLSQLPDAHQ